MNRLLAAVSVLLCLSPVYAGAGEETVKLRPAKSDAARMQARRFIRLDGKGRAEIDFPTERGKLLFEFSNGVVRADVNSDGVIDEADGEGAPPGTNKPLAVPVSAGARSFRYPLVVQYATKDYVSLGTFIALRGEFEGHTLDLIDRDVNGVFGGLGSDGLVVVGDRATGRGFAGEPSPLAPVQVIGGELYDIKVLDAGTSLRISPFEGEKATLTLRAGENVAGLTLTLQKTDKRFFCTASSGVKMVLAAGEYSVTQSRATVKTGAPERKGLGALFGGSSGGGIGMLYGYSREGDCTITVSPGENTVDAGPPFRLDLEATVTGGKEKQYKVTDAYLIGAAGERYRADCRSGDKKGELRCIVRSGGKDLSTCKLEYG